MSQQTGLVIGKFNPPHLGHLNLINVGASKVDHLDVVLCGREDQTIPLEKRHSWLKQVVPANVKIILTKDDLPAENEPWAERCLEILPRSPDLVFSSEDYGEPWAQLMRAKHFLVDRDRTEFPISGSEIRKDLGEHFHWLVPSAKEDLCRKFVMVGAESTGKTTMAEALAKKLNTVWVPEHGRWYWEGRRYLKDQSWSTDEFFRIAKAQINLQKDLARLVSKGILICDTDALVTAVWHQRYLSKFDKLENFMSFNDLPDLYLICCPDFDWIQDGTRESKDYRLTMHETIIRYVKQTGIEYLLLEGAHEKRFEDAINAIKKHTVFPVLK